MKAVLKYGVIIVVLGVALHWVLALMVPSLAMNVAYDRVSVNGPNQLSTISEVDHDARKVVRPSPDLLYGACAYDLSKGDLMITADVPKQYWSLQFYDMQTNNFAGITNQRDEQWRSDSKVNVLLSLEPKMAITTVTNIVAPHQKGIALVRLSNLEKSEASMQALSSVTCEIAKS